jgi:hypothetical protein
VLAIKAQILRRSDERGWRERGGNALRSPAATLQQLVTRRDRPQPERDCRSILVCKGASPEVPMPRADNHPDNGIIELRFGETITRAISNSRPDLNLLLRMKDEASARQLMVEADCLRAARRDQ